MGRRSRGASLCPAPDPTSNEGEEPTDLHSLLSTFQASPTKRLKELENAPFNYLSINTDLVGWILERAGGKKLNVLISELIWRPLGAEADASLGLDPGGNARAAGGMRATLRDIARVGTLIIGQSNSVVPSAWVQDMLHEGSKEAFAAGGWQKDLSRMFPSIAYRSFWLADSDTETLMAVGIHGQLLIVDRANAIVIAKVSSQPARLDEAKKMLAVEAFKEFQRILLDQK